jgi:MoaA/NifB/PqqE/SkfB family radical SAM enzyme
MFGDYFGHLALEITNACNLKCKMCSIWREKPAAQISKTEIIDVIERLNERYTKLGKKYAPLATLTGGEPFLHPQFNQIYRKVQDYRKLGYLSSIYIISNGFFTKRVINFLRKNERARLRMDFSVDGLEENHNDERGDPDSFKNMLNTIDGIREEFPSLPVSVKFTINSKNYGDLFKIYELCLEKGLGLRFLVTVFPWNGFYNRCGEDVRKGELKIDDKQRKEILDMIVKIYKDMKKRGKLNMVVGKESHMLSLLKNLRLDYIKRCTSPIKELFINSHGDVYPCIYKKPIANIRERGWENNIFSDYHGRLIEEGLKRDCPMKQQHCNFLKITKTGLL